jgi:hypothetical protein
MARDYAQLQIDLGPARWQLHVYTHFNDLSENDSWTVLISDCRFELFRRIDRQVVW